MKGMAVDVILNDMSRTKRLGGAYNQPPRPAWPWIVDYVLHPCVLGLTTWNWRWAFYSVHTVSSESEMHDTYLHS